MVSLDERALGDLPWMVKGQTLIGGRGKAGAIAAVGSRAEAESAIARIRTLRVRGQPVHGFRVERKVAYRHETYLSLMVEPAHACIRILVSSQGGVDVEERAQETGAMLSAVAAADLASVTAAGHALIERLADELKQPLRDAIARCADFFFQTDAVLLEVNPLFICDDSTWLLGDLKLNTDENAIVRRPELNRLVMQRPDVYREAAFKLTHGFDYVEIDPDGEVGMLTTGAGLSMLLIDEMLRAGRKPFNFCDIRSGQFRGKPDRLIEMLRRFADAPRIGVVFVNIFAGITDLGEFTLLLLTALEQVPRFDKPIVARLIGNNFDTAKRMIAESGRDIQVEPDLDKALAAAVQQSTPSYA